VSFPAWLRTVIDWFALADAVSCLLFTVCWLLFSNTNLRKDSYSMSDKDRNKKDGENKDKKNQRMREAVDAREQNNPTARQKEKHEAKMTDTIPEGEARRRKRT
jgi:hypothetical protein